MKSVQIVLPKRYIVVLCALNRKLLVPDEDHTSTDCYAYMYNGVFAEAVLVLGRFDSKVGVGEHRFGWPMGTLRSAQSRFVLRSWTLLVSYSA